MRVTTSAARPRLCTLMAVCTDHGPSTGTGQAKALRLPCALQGCPVHATPPCQSGNAQRLQSPGSDHLDADGKPLPAWKVRMRQRHRFWSTSMGFKVALCCHTD